MSWTKYLRVGLELSRVGEYIGIVIGLTALGYFPWRENSVTSLVSFTALVIMNLSSYAFAFMINDIEDADDDSRDIDKARRNPVSAGRITRGHGLWLSAIVATISVLLSLWYPPVVIVLNLTTLLLGFGYSWRRIRLKSLPLLDIVSHALFLGALPYLTVVFAGGVEPSLLVTWGALSVFSVSLVGDIHNELRDFAVDQTTKLHNTVQTLRLDRFHYLVNPLQAITVVSCIIYAVSVTSWAITGGAIALIGIIIMVLALSRLRGRNSLITYTQREILIAFVTLILIVLRFVVPVS